MVSLPLNASYKNLFILDTSVLQDQLYMFVVRRMLMTEKVLLTRNDLAFCLFDNRCGDCNSQFSDTF